MSRRAFLIVERGEIYIPIWKNASNSLTHSLRIKYSLHPVHVHELPLRPEPKFAMLREPRERLESAWRMLRDGYSDIGFSDWVCRVCDGLVTDRHVEPQMDHIRDCDVHLIRWDFDEWRRTFDLDEVPHLNREPPELLRWSDEAIARFNTAFEEDVRLWLRLDR